MSQTQAELGVAAPGTVLVTFTPSEPELTLRLNSADGSVPVVCDAACTVSVQIDVRYELAIFDRHGVSSKHMYFWQPENLVVSPPNRALRTAGATVLTAGAALFVVSGGVFTYAAIRNLSVMECENDCDAVSPSVIKASLIGMGASFVSILIGGGLVLANSGPNIDQLPSRAAAEPNAGTRAAAMSLGAESKKRLYEPFVTWRVAF